jgi:hypothetical protein
VDLAYSASSIPNSAVYELHGVVEPITTWQYLINQALKRCFVVVEFTLTPTADQTRHDLTTGQTWLTNHLWVRQAGYLTTGETRANVDPYRHRRISAYTEKVSNLVYLVHPNRSFTSSETLYIKAIKRGYDHCRASGSGAYGDQAGLSAEAHQAEPLAEWVAYAALVELGEQLDNLGGVNKDARDMVKAKRAEWRDRYAEYRAREFKPPPRDVREIITWGPVATR